MQYARAPEMRDGFGLRKRSFVFRRARPDCVGSSPLLYLNKEQKFNGLTRKKRLENETHVVLYQDFVNFFLCSQL